MGCYKWRMTIGWKRLFATKLTEHDARMRLRKDEKAARNNLSVSAMPKSEPCVASFGNVFATPKPGPAVPVAARG